MGRRGVKRATSRKAGAPVRNRSAGNAPRQGSPSLKHFHLSPEMEWLQRNHEKLQAYAGEWVVLTADGVLANGVDYLEVRSHATSEGIRTPFIFRVPEPTDAAFMGL